MASNTNTPPTATPPLAFRPTDAARTLGVCTKTLSNWTKAGLVPHIKVGGTTLYPVEALREWLSGRAAKGGETP